MRHHRVEGPARRAWWAATPPHCGAKAGARKGRHALRAQHLRLQEGSEGPWRAADVVAALTRPCTRVLRVRGVA